ncbi:DNA repair protein RecN [Labilithrix luteola]|uniref:DNA repair protein RecN n=1 Tax=Labilithrix luteola TaxID=1391654 RepID=A0A0K1Q6W2_9BACT|nr:DNA repair protein RecN [Labilithrix luteola]AKV01473.1 DNA repair protein RecN [Labilithrix luteola]
MPAAVGVIDRVDPMLHSITIDNVVLIEHQVVELGPGFNVLTGETGAGKSMVIDALALVLGGRARPDAVRSGTREAEVAALFEVEAGSRVADKLEAAGVPCDGELVVRRVVQAEGRSRAFLNGKVSTAAQLAELAPDLCDIASQHESVSLTDPGTHLEYLDAFGKLDIQRDSLAEKVAELSGIVREIEKVREAERDRAEREDFLAFQYREIEDLDPSLGEETELESERARLRHAEKLQTATQAAADRLYEGDDTVCDQLARISSELDAAAAIDQTLAPHARAVESAREELADAARALSRYASGIETSAERLAEVDDRWFRLQKLLRKHGPTTHELLAHRDDLKRQLDQLAGASDLLAELEAKRDDLLSTVAVEARGLSRKRRDAAANLADSIGRELGGLGMGRARVVVDVSPVPAPVAGELPLVDGARLTSSGIDRVEFLIAPNKGEDPRPLRKIASGGELSRALLALKRVLAEKGPAGLYVFDEVDAGVSGAIAEVIGRAIADVARHRQVLCITHLPQIAALADQHFVVGKTEVKGRTTSTLKRLSASERVEEIARMIGGVKVGEAARRAAVELLGAKK